MPGSLPTFQPAQISIDGYSACGKSTLAQGLAHRLGFLYIDSGAMYRGVTLYFLRNQLAFDQNPGEDIIHNIQIGFQSVHPDEEAALLLNGENVHHLLRSREVNAHVSEVAALPEIRSHLVRLQQEYGRSDNVVMDGRDIGSTVFPNAVLKIFLTADIDTRVRRRLADAKADSGLSFEAVKNNLLHRDHIDSTRKDSPLRQTSDAVLIDNTNLTIEEQLEMVLTLAQLRLANR